jgi:hypothetical protein
MSNGEWSIMADLLNLFTFIAITGSLSGLYSGGKSTSKLPNLHTPDN